MKRLDDHTRDEMIALTDDQIQTLIDVECAYTGLPLLPPEPVQPTPVIAEGDTELFECVGINFVSQEDALKVARFIAGMESANVAHEWHSGKDYIRDHSIANPTIKAKRVLSERAFRLVEHDLRAYREARQSYDEAIKARTKLLEQRIEVVDRVRGAIGAARGDEQERESLRTAFERYRALADDSVEIALRFLRSSYGAVCERHADLVRQWESEAAMPQLAPPSSSLDELL